MTIYLVKQPAIKSREERPAATSTDHESFPVRRFIAGAIIFFVIAASGVSFGAIQLLEPHRDYFGRVGDRFVAKWEKSESPVIQILRD